MDLSSRSEALLLANPSTSDLDPVGVCRRHTALHPVRNKHFIQDTLRLPLELVLIEAASRSYAQGILRISDVIYI